MIRIGIVTILFNCDGVLDSFFKCLSSQNFYDYHLYLIDNSPSKETDELLSRLLKKYPISSHSHVKMDYNVGFATANNIGIKLALKDSCQYILISNNDIEFNDPSLLVSLLKTAENRHEYLIAPKIYFFETHKVWFAGGYFNWWKAMGVHIGEWKDDNRKYNKEMYCDYAPLCFVLIRSMIFEKIELLDEKFFVYFEDTDFFYRVKKLGFKIFYFPQIKIYHKVGTSSGGYDSLFGIYYGNRNRIYFIKKHLGIIKKVVALFYFFTTRAIKYFKYNNKQRIELTRAIKDGFLLKINEE